MLILRVIIVTFVVYGIYGAVKNIKNELAIKNFSIRKILIWFSVGFFALLVWNSLSIDLQIDSGNNFAISRISGDPALNEVKIVFGDAEFGDPENDSYINKYRCYGYKYGYRCLGIGIQVKLVGYLE